MLEAQKQRSDVARILAQISTEYEAAVQGVTGLSSGTSRHDFISQKMENMGKLHTQLHYLVGDRAIALVAEQLQGCPNSTSQSVQPPGS
jgi:hypothetical protein